MNKMNLQLFGTGLFEPGTTQGTNPLLLDSAPAPEAPVAADPVELHDTPEPVAEPAPAAPALDMDALVAKLTESISAASQQQPPAAAEPAVSGPTPEEQEEQEELNSKMRDEFLDNPTGFMDKMAASIRADAEASILEQVAPVLEREKAMQRGQELQAQVDAFRSQTPDFDEYIGEIGQYLAEKPHLESAPDALEVAYDAVKGRRSQDPDAIRQKALADPAIKESVIKEYLESIKAGQPPVIVAGSGNLGMPTTQEKPTTLKGASALFAQSMRSKGL